MDAADGCLHIVSAARQSIIEETLTAAVSRTTTVPTDDRHPHRSEFLRPNLRPLSEAVVRGNY